MKKVFCFSRFHFITGDVEMYGPKCSLLPYSEQNSNGCFLIDLQACVIHSLDWHVGAIIMFLEIVAVPELLSPGTNVGGATEEIC